jgi:hypothetical protein
MTLRGFCISTVIWLAVRKVLSVRMAAWCLATLGVDPDRFETGVDRLLTRERWERAMRDEPP